MYERQESDERWLETSRLGRAALLRRATAAGIGVSALGGVGLVETAVAASSPPTSGKAISMSDLIAAAQQEGHLNTIALPPDWTNYKAFLAGFPKKYKIGITNAAPDDSSAQENQAIKSLKGQSRGPDVLDVGPSFAAQGKSAGLYTPYKNSYWETIPANMKDAQGYWVGDYWGVIAFGVNTKIVNKVPKTWADLKDPAFSGKIALNGDPRQAGAAFAGVFSAALGNGGSLDNIMPGIQFFADLKKAGNFVTVQATPATIANGQTPVTIDWDYLQLSYRDEFKSKLPWTISIPSTGVFGNYYCQAISKYAPHPYAARLWQEYCYSDTGQLQWLAGYGHPARFADMTKRGVIPKALLAKLPPAAAYKNVKFPTLAQAAKATQVLAAQWGPMVAGS
jgi:putative spermidine/putrescine transport system substrate-binding protein